MKIEKIVPVPVEFFQEWKYWYPDPSDGLLIVDLLERAAVVERIDQDSYLRAIYQDLFEIKRFSAKVKDRYLSTYRIDKFMSMPNSGVVVYEPLPIAGERMLLLPSTFLRELKTNLIEKNYTVILEEMERLSASKRGDEYLTLMDILLDE